MRAIIIPAALLLGVAGCAPMPAHDAASLTTEEIEATGIVGAQDRLSVGEAMDRAPAGTVGVIDVRIAAGLGDEQITVDERSLEAVLDWIVVGTCASPGAVPPILVGAVPAADAVVLNEQPRSWNLECTWLGEREEP